MKRVLLALMVVAVFAGSVSASITITPTTNPQWTGTAVSVPGIYTQLAALDPSIILSNDDILYKNDYDYDTGTETGPYKNYYETDFTGDPNDATITWVLNSPYYITDPTYLLVKDGMIGDPAWYLFDLNNLNGVAWNGQDTITLSGFWTGQGAISHVAIYGTNTIPEPASLAIWAVIAAGGAAVAARKRRGRWAKANREAILGIIEKT